MHVVTEINRQDFRLHLTNVDESTWQATFSGAPMPSGEGFGAGATRWQAVQVATWEAIK